MRSASFCAEYSAIQYDETEWKQSLLRQGFSQCGDKRADVTSHSEGCLSKVLIDSGTYSAKRVTRNAQCKVSLLNFQYLPGISSQAS